MKELREVIAENLPTFLEKYRYPPSTLPTRHELLVAADRIIAAIQSEGYQFYEYNPRPR